MVKVKRFRKFDRCTRTTRQPAVDYYSQPAWDYYIAKLYHFYDMHFYHIAKFFERFQDKSDIDDYMPYTARQDERCYYLSNKNVEVLKTYWAEIELDRDDIQTGNEHPPVV